jgi:hypothetical protein
MVPRGLRVVMWSVAVLVGGALALSVLMLNAPAPHGTYAARPRPLPTFRHVFIIMMENRSLHAILHGTGDPYIRFLAAHYAVDTAYYGITHPSLPNYVAAIAGTTGGTHSDNPTQTFAFETVADQLDAKHIAWQAVMGGLPSPGYTGNWYPPGPPGLSPITMPTNALYAKKHDPFLLFPRLARRDAPHIVPLTTLGQELKAGRVPRFVWISPDLCDDMHGQPVQTGTQCPANRSQALVRAGNAFLARWVPRILRSAAFHQGPSVIFLTWDEAGDPRQLSLAAFRSYAAQGPGSPPLIEAVPWVGSLGGGQVPLIVITNDGPHGLRIPLWADHYSLLKTIEADWHLGYLGEARNPAVPVLWPFFYPPAGSH